MASVIGIVNSALYKVGAKKQIVSLDEGTPAANFMSARYEDLRDDLLRAHPWNFAVKRVKLARLAETPAYEYDYKYAMPSDIIRTLLLSDNSAGTGVVDYREESGTYFSNAEELWLKYVYKVTDPNQMTADFREVLALKIAIEAAITIANSNSMSETMEARFQKAMLKAMSVDSMSDRPSSLPSGSWTTCRSRAGVGTWPV